MDFDEAIDLTEYGRFHYEIIAASALCIITAGFQNGLSGYLLPAAQDDLDLSSEQIGFLNVAFLVGGISSSFLWGVIAGIGGRRKVLMMTLLADFFISFTGAFFITSFTTFAVCRFLNGFLIGAPGSLTFPYLAEFQPKKYRAKSVCYSGVFLTSTWLLLPVLAYAVLPLEVDWKIWYLPEFKSWRLFLVVLVIPELLAGVWLLRLPESPKFLIAVGDHSAALSVLKKIYVTNTGKAAEEFPIKELTTNEIQVSCKENIALGILKDSLKQLKQLFDKNLRFFTLAGCWIMFSNMFGLYGLGIWLPELFVRFEQFKQQYPNTTATVKELSKIKLSTCSNCTFEIQGSVFHNTLAIGISSLSANILSGVFAGRLSLNVIPLLTMISGGLSAGSIYFLNSSLQNSIVSCIFMSAMATANVVTGSVIVELFPTCVSAIAICVAICAGRLGAICSNVIFGLFVDKKCEIPIFLVAAVVLLGCCACFILPRKSTGSVEITAHETIYRKRKIEISVVETYKYECHGHGH